MRCAVSDTEEKGNVRKYPKLAVVLPALLGIGVTVFASQKILQRYRMRAVPAPVVPMGSSLTRGTLINLNTNQDQYQNVIKGKVLLVFVTTGCDACRKELSNLSQFAPSLASKVAIYGVGIESRESVKAFVATNHIELPMLLDDGGATIRQFGLKFMPTKVLLQDGAILKIWYGTSPDRNALMKDLGEVETK